MLPLVAIFALALPGAEPADWKKAESAHLKNIRQLTFPAAFARAGEGYFAPDGKTILFQAEEKGGDNPFYQIYTMDLATHKFRRVSPGVGKTTCSFFSPDRKKIIFASTHLDPGARSYYDKEKRQRAEDRKSGKRRRYSWDFDPAFDVFEANPDGTDLRRLTTAKGYDAEGSYSPDGRQIVFCSGRTGNGFELFVMDRDGKNVRQLTHAPGCYNGGPFFSPDGKRVIFRADRKRKDQLQLYVIDADGKNERALTDDLHWVQWGPYWYRDSRHILYAGANHGVKGRPNYDLYWMDVDTGKKVRITYFPGADVLPVFSPDGKKVMWTSTRGDGSSQLFLADFTPPQE